jgi:hypothetical protein
MRAALIGFLGLLVLPAGAGAQVYHWVDEDGVIYYTTGLESVPERFRSTARLVAEPSTDPAPPPGPLPGAAPSEGDGGSTTITFTPGSPVLVGVRINRLGPVTLVLDTGADRTLVSPAALARLGIPTQSAGETLVRGVSGEGRGDIVWVTSLEVGQAASGPIPIVAYDPNLQYADGLLGRDFLDRFKVTIDAQQGVVTLAPN